MYQVLEFLFDEGIVYNLTGAGGSSTITITGG